MNIPAKAHYVEQATQFGASKQSTMLDTATRDKEIEIIRHTFKLISPKSKLLEVGCGNGYTAAVLKLDIKAKIVGIDTCKELLDIARARRLKEATFQIGDVAKLRFPDEAFDAVLSERCLINLPNWKLQKKAIGEIWRVLKPQGKLLMIETFTDGQKAMNQAREELGLPPNPVPEYNCQFVHSRLCSFIVGKFTVISQSNFLSTYYFGSRILYPALIKNKGVKYNTTFVQFFKDLPPIGNYSPIQAWLLEKI